MSNVEYNFPTIFSLYFIILLSHNILWYIDRHFVLDYKCGQSILLSQICDLSCWSREAEKKSKSFVLVISAFPHYFLFLLLFLNL